MSDATPAAPTDFNTRVINEFRANGGRRDGFDGMPMALVHTTGARSGQERVTPLMACPDGDKIYVFASAQGAPKHPAWYHNLLANPHVTVEYEGDKFEATASSLEGDDYQHVRDLMKSKTQILEDHLEKAKATRIIPIVSIVRS